MKRRGVQAKGSHSQQRGYALLMIIFLCTLVLISAVAVSPNILTEGRREREREMIWRGNQYVRAISLYRRKTGKFPTSIDDLVKGQPGIRFLRRPYKDPFNTKDGSWRLIYLGPAGQLIGSLNPNNRPLVAFPPAIASTTPAAASGGTDAFSKNSIQSGAQLQSAAPAATASDPPPEPPAGNLADTPVVMGAPIVGVGSKIDQPSVITFNKAHNYRFFEFIWDATKELNVSGLPGVPGALAKDPNFQPPQAPPAEPSPVIPNPEPPIPQSEPSKPLR